MTKRVVGVRFRKAGRMYYFDPGTLEINEGDGVVVETSRGVEYGDVVLSPRDVLEEQIVAPLKEVMRVATPEDREIHERNLQLEQEAFSICQEKITQHTLDMKLVDVEYTFNGSKITFFFTSEGRVDFRELVKDLAFVFKTRIELRQIGVRDEAKMLGGLGSCGLPVCCKTFLADFQPVSIKMAKEQKLSLSPTKISGLCGRLMCCLKYEQDSYESMRKLMPRVGKDVITPDGRGIVIDNNVITEKTKVRITMPDGTPELREYHFSIVRKPGTPEEEEAMRKELAASAKARETEAAPKEEEFRFVTGHVAEVRPAPQEVEPAKEPVQQQAPRRQEQGQRPQQQPRQNRPRREDQPRQERPKQEAQKQDGPRQERSGQPRRDGQRPPQGGQPRRDGEKPRVQNGQPRPQKAPRPQQTDPQQPNPQQAEGAPEGQAPKPRNHRNHRSRRRKPAGAGTPPPPTEG